MKLKIVGVPEHFNYPWKLAFADGRFSAAGIDATWSDIPEGTGKMCSMLRDGSADIAVILTEGIVKDIISGNPSKIVQVYVESPLIWGIHVAAKSDYEKLEDVKDGKIAISRYGSGSHLMAIINAQQQNWDAGSLKFEIVHTIDGAVKALTDGAADYFMWERFMTKPLVDQGVFRRIGECPTPWSCFVIAVRNEVIENAKESVVKILEIINGITSTFKQIPQIDRTLAEAFGQETEDIREWLSLTEWSQKTPSEFMLNKVQNQLLDLSLIDKNGTFAEIVKAL